MDKFATYEEWEAQVPPQIKSEAVWKFLGYRKPLNIQEFPYSLFRAQLF